MRPRLMNTGFSVLLLALPLLFLARPAAAAQDDSPFLTILYTWAPVLLIVALWIFFMRRMGWGGFGKGGYKEYLRVNQERMENIDRSLARIAEQLERLVEVTAKK